MVVAAGAGRRDAVFVEGDSAGDPRTNLFMPPAQKGEAMTVGTSMGV